MTLKKQIKLGLILFVVLFIAFAGAFLFLFKKNYYDFNVQIYQKSDSNIRIMQTLSAIQTQLYIHKNMLARYLKTGRADDLSVVKEAKAGMRERLDFLTLFNKEKLNTDQKQTNPKLRDFLALFSRLSQDFNLYFSRTDNLIANRDTKTRDVGPPLTAAEDDQVRLLLAGLNDLSLAYQSLFWDQALFRQSAFITNTKNYFYALLAASVALLLLALLIVNRVFTFFYSQRVPSESLALLGFQDGATGLFNQKSFQIMGAKELQRSKRRGYHLSLLLIGIEPFQQIKADFGAKAFDRLMFQVAQVLKTSFRSYDGLYRYDQNTFAILLSETDFRAVYPIVKRFKNKLVKTAFLVKDNAIKVVPRVSMGFAVYPADGDRLDELVQKALAGMTDHFEAYVTHHHPVQSGKERADEEPPPEAPANREKTTEKTRRPDDRTVRRSDQPIVGHTEGRILGRSESQNEEPDRGGDVGGKTLVAETLDDEELAGLSEAVATIVGRYGQRSPWWHESPVESNDRQEGASPRVAPPKSEALPDVVAALTQDEAPVVSQVSSDERPAPGDELDLLHASESDDVILVDFDRERNDLAQRFRRKQKDSKKLR